MPRSKIDTIDLLRLGKSDSESEKRGKANSESQERSHFLAVKEGKG